MSYSNAPTDPRARLAGGLAARVERLGLRVEKPWLGDWRRVSASLLMHADHPIGYTKPIAEKAVNEGSGPPAAFECRAQPPLSCAYAEQRHARA